MIRYESSAIFKKATKTRDTRRCKGTGKCYRSHFENILGYCSYHGTSWARMLLFRYGPFVLDFEVGVVRRDQQLPMVTRNVRLPVMFTQEAFRILITAIPDCNDHVAN